MRRPLLAAFLLATSLIASPASAHPHVFVDTATTILHDAEGRISGFRHVWTFDELYSTFATQGLDVNRDGTYSREELADLTRVNVENLGEMGFFTVMRHDRRFVSFDKAGEAFSEVKDGKLVLTFTVSLKTPFRAERRPVHVQIYDPSFFVAFHPVEGEPVRLADAPAGCGLGFEPPRRNDGRSVNLSEAFFQALGSTANFGEQFAGRYTLTCR